MRLRSPFINRPHRMAQSTAFTPTVSIPMPNSASLLFPLTCKYWAECKQPTTASCASRAATPINMPCAGFLDACKRDPSQPAQAFPLRIHDKKSACYIAVDSLGDGQYSVRAETEAEGVERRTATIARGLIRLGEMEASDSDANRVNLPAAMPMMPLSPYYCCALPTSVPPCAKQKKWLAEASSSLPVHKIRR